MLAALVPCLVGPTAARGNRLDTRLAGLVGRDGLGGTRSLMLYTGDRRGLYSSWRGLFSQRKPAHQEICLHPNLTGMPSTYFAVYDKSARAHLVTMAYTLYR